MNPANLVRATQGLIETSSVAAKEAGEMPGVRGCGSVRGDG
jgi:hypothetical protein